jgi:hypothetical protein
VLSLRDLDAELLEQIDKRGQVPATLGAVMKERQ